MKTSSVVLIVISLVLAVSLIAVWFYPSIRDFMASNTMWNGIRNFTSQFGEQTIDSLNNLPGEPEQEILLSIPYLALNQEDLSKIKQFVDGGNTLLLMDDFGYGNDVLTYLGINARFDHSLLLDPLFCYKNEYFPRITDFAPAIKEKGVEAIAFNHATFLINVDEAHALAWSSKDSFADINKNGTKNADEKTGPFIVAAEYQVGQGTVEIVSDPSLIINTMVNRNDNYLFIRTLTERNGKQQSLLLDNSHLSKSPLDVSKASLDKVRSALSNPYLVLLFVAVIFILVPAYTLKKGEVFG
jgi:hypothetical protein